MMRITITARTATHASVINTMTRTVTESTFWFDIHYVIFGLLLIGTCLLIANVIWKRKLMKEEQTLIARGKEAVA